MSSVANSMAVSLASTGDGKVEVTYDNLSVTFNRIDRKTDSKEKFDAWCNFMLSCKDMLKEEGYWSDGIESRFDFASYGNLGSALQTLKSYARSLFNSSCLDEYKHPKFYVNSEPWQKAQQYVAKSDSELYLTSSMVKDKFDAIVKMENPRVRAENLLRLYDACYDMFKYCGIAVSGRQPIHYDGMSAEEVAEKMLTLLTTDNCFYDFTAQYFTVSKSLWESINTGNADVQDAIQRMLNGF